jgi:hypothetical protein
MGFRTTVLLVFIIVFFNTQVISGQEATLVTELSSNIQESSGLLYINERLFTHNDSGGASELYEINTTNGSIVRTISISNATNVDWEDLAADETHIYIGDIGNNSGDRTDLKIYKVAIAEVLNSNSASADIINFNYGEQTDFTPNPGPVFTTDFDAEALVCFNNNLYLFTKQWTTQSTQVYQVPKTPGDYELDAIDSIASAGLITGADKSLDGSALLLLGYSNLLAPFIIELSGFGNSLFSNGNFQKISINPPSGFSGQVEGITAFNHSEFYLSSEAFFTLRSGLYTYTSNALGLTEQMIETVDFYPNPAKDFIYFKDFSQKVQVYSLSGQLLINQRDINKLDISNIKTGVYFLVITNNLGHYSTKKLIVL